MSTFIYAQYLQHMLDSDYKNKIEIYDMLERAKDSAIVDKKYKQKQNLPNMAPLQRFGIVAACSSSRIDYIYKLYFGERCSECSLENFLNRAKSSRLNVLTITNISKSPVEYDIARLIDKDTAQDYIFNSEYGVNDKIMERFENIRELSSCEKEMGYKINQHVSSIGAQWIVLQSIGYSKIEKTKKLWSAMTNKCIAISQSEFKPTLKKLLLPNSLIQKILRGPSQRIQSYQKPKNDKLMSMFVKPLNNEQEVKIDKKSLINNLIHRITNRILLYVDESLTPLPTTQQKLEEAIMDPMFTEIMNIEMLQSYSITGVDIKLPTYELVGSFISDVDNNIIVQFSRNLKNNMIEMGPSAKLFREYSGENLKTRLYNIFIEIIKKSIISTIKSKVNVYEMLLIKNNMLNEMK